MKKKTESFKWWIFLAVVLALIFLNETFLGKNQQKIILDKEYELKDVAYFSECLYPINEEYLRNVKIIYFKGDLGKSRNNPLLEVGGRAKSNTLTMYIGEVSCRVALHEFAHFVFWSLNDEQQQEWIEIHKNSGLFVTDYAKIDYQEDFADSLQIYWESEAGIRDLCPELDCYKMFEERDKLEKEKIIFFFENIKPNEKGWRKEADEYSN